MKNIILLHTQFNAAFTGEIINENFLTREVIYTDRDGDEATREVNFGLTEGLAVVTHQNNEVSVDFNPVVSAYDDVDELILLVSDEFYKFNSTEIMNRIIRFLSPLEYNIRAICHQRESYREFVTQFSEKFSDNLITPIQMFSHFEDETNPFYALVNLVNSSCKEEFLASLNIIKATFPTEKEVQEIDDLNEKLNVLYKLLGNDLSKAELKKLPIVTTDIKVDRVQYIREVRDKMFEKF